MYHTIKEFLQDWSNESQTTLKVLSSLSDESLGQKVYNEGRSLGEIAWHIAKCIGEMAGSTGIKIEVPADDAPVPEKAEEIKMLYQTSAIELLRQVENDWKDSDLLEEIDMYGETWTKAMTLEILIRHEIHHRGQLTVLMRQAGLKVPGVCGPSKEEWAEMNMPAAK